MNEPVKERFQAWREAREQHHEFVRASGLLHVDLLGGYTVLRVPDGQAPPSAMPEKVSALSATEFDKTYPRHSLAAQRRYRTERAVEAGVAVGLILIGAGLFIDAIVRLVS